MNPEQAIKTKEEDAFERYEFAKHLADILYLEKDEASIVVGIEAKWGEGKTSCINLVKEALKEKKLTPIIVEYKPWLISTLDSLIEGFFIDLATAIGSQSRTKNASQAAQKVLKFGKMIAPIKLIPGVEPWGSLVESVLNSVGGATQAVSELKNLSLQSRKEALEEELKKISRSILVIIDDVDRLPPQQVRIVFQMIKAICDFNRVSYLIAYDPTPIKKALSYNELYNGEKYLEKIIQISYPLPRLSITSMKDFLSKHLKEIESKCKLEFSETESELLNIMLRETNFIRLLETPRDVIRLYNRLRLSASNTKNEVAFADLVAFELLEMKFNEVTQIIRDEPTKFISGFSKDEELYSTSDNIAAYEAFREIDENEDDQIDILLRPFNEYKNRKESLRSILLYLFPKLYPKNQSVLEVPDSVTRVHNRDAFLKLLHCGITSFTYSHNEAQTFFTESEERSQILKNYEDSNDLIGWLTFLTYSVKDAEITDNIGVCDAFIELIKNKEKISTPMN